MTGPAPDIRPLAIHLVRVTMRADPLNDPQWMDGPVYATLQAIEGLSHMQFTHLVVWLSWVATVFAGLLPEGRAGEVLTELGGSIDWLLGQIAENLDRLDSPEGEG